MIIGNISHKYIHNFPEIHESNMKLYVHNELINFNLEKNFSLLSELIKEYDKIIIDCSFESPHFDQKNKVIDILRGPNTNKDILWIDSGLDNIFKNKTIYDPSIIRLDNKSMLKVQDRTILYISLSRLIHHRFFRLLFTHELYKKDLLSDGIVTCGTASDDIDMSDLFVLFPKEFQKILPLTYDGLVERYPSSVTYLTFGMECLINVVLETSFDRTLSEKYPSIYLSDNNGHGRPFITEKTLKAFNAGQIPLFVTVSGYVNILKIMGFDVFDDIIDHSYDNEINPEKRIVMVADELLRLKKIGLENLKNTPNLEERFNYNKTQLKILHKQMFKRYKLFINSWFFNGL